MTKILTRALGGIALGLGLTTGAQAQDAGDIATAALTAIFTDHDTAAAEALIATNYIQHNPAIPTGITPILGFIPVLADSGLTLTIQRVISDGDFAMVHSAYDGADVLGAPALVGFDVFRVEDGKLAEHWDNLSPTQAANPSGHTQLDGPTEITDLDKTDANKMLVKNFVQAILVEGDMAQLAGFFDGDSYIQHNAQIADGLSGLGDALGALAAQGITMEYDTIHQVIGEGNFVFVMSEGRFGGAPTAFYDLFRVENGFIAEHWDVIADIPAEMAHDNGKF